MRFRTVLIVKMALNLGTSYYAGYTNILSSRAYITYWRRLCSI